MYLTVILEDSWHQTLFSSHIHTKEQKHSCIRIYMSTPRNREHRFVILFLSHTHTHICKYKIICAYKYTSILRSIEHRFVVLSLSHTHICKHIHVYNYVRPPLEAQLTDLWYSLAEISTSTSSLELIQRRGSPFQIPPKLALWINNPKSLETYCFKDLRF